MFFVRQRNERIYTLRNHHALACTFQAQKFRNDGAITYQGPVFSNLILDSGLDQLADTGFGVGTGSGSFINVGEDNTDPDKSQTGLLDFLAASDKEYDRNHGYSTDSPVNKWREVTFEFAIGSCTGNLTELGLSKGEDSGYFNRQLFRDSDGDPTTITVNDDEGLRITARLYLYSFMEPGDSDTGSFTLNDDTTKDFTREMTTNTEWLEQYESQYDEGLYLTHFHEHEKEYFRISEDDTTFGGNQPDEDATKLDYSSGDFYRDFEAVWPAGDFVGDMKSICMRFPVDKGGRYNDEDFIAFRLDNPITVEDTEEVKFTFRRSWGRYAS